MVDLATANLRPALPEGKTSAQVSREAKFEEAIKQLPSMITATRQNTVAEFEVAELGGVEFFNPEPSIYTPLKFFRFNNPFTGDIEGERLERHEFMIKNPVLEKLVEAIENSGCTPFVFYTADGGGTLCNIPGYARLGARLGSENFES